MKYWNARLARSSACGVAAAALLTLGASSIPAQADDVADFYTGKTVTVVIGYPPGGVFDSGGRMIVRHMGKHIPGNPTLIPTNMPGGGSLVAANFLFNVAPKDGTTIGLIGNSLPISPIWDREGVQFKAEEFNWLGSLQRWTGIALLRKDAPIDSLEDAASTEVLLGGTGSGDVTIIYPRILNALLGTKFNAVPGYRGSADLNLAIESGEVKGRMGWDYAAMAAEKPDWVAESKIKVVAQLGLTKNETLPDAPMVIDMAKTDEDRQIMQLVFGSQEIALPFLAPPGVPEDRVAALRQAFEATVKDPEFLADAKKAGLSVNPSSWQHVEEVIQEAYAIPQPVIARAIPIINGK